MLLLSTELLLALGSGCAVDAPVAVSARGADLALATVVLPGWALPGCIPCAVALVSGLPGC